MWGSFYYVLELLGWLGVGAYLGGVFAGVGMLGALGFSYLRGAFAGVGMFERPGFSYLGNLLAGTGMLPCVSASRDALNRLMPIKKEHHQTFLSL